jgi:DNA invertase Pin-like site-specific DNA recombinase
VRHLTDRVKTIVIWKLDRLSRRLRDGINTLADWCEKNIKIVVITQQIELSGAVGRICAHPWASHRADELR